MKVLIVEDEILLAKQLSRALSEAGYAVDHAADGERGEFLGRTEDYDAVILDLGLPKMDGLTVLHQWREASVSTPVKLTSHEFRVLSYLMHHRGRIVSQSELTEHIYAQGFDRDSNTVEVFIARLRRKLGGTVIETVRGMGYRIEAGQ